MPKYMRIQEQAKTYIEKSNDKKKKKKSSDCYLQDIKTLFYNLELKIMWIHIYGIYKFTCSDVPSLYKAKQGTSSTRDLRNTNWTRWVRRAPSTHVSGAWLNMKSVRCTEQQSYTSTHLLND